MVELEFQEYLSKNLNLDLALVNDVFEIKKNDDFQVALTLIKDYKIDKNILGKLWGNYIGFAYVNPNSSIVNKELVDKAGIKFIRENNALPLYKFGKAVTAATSNPTNPFLQDKIEKKLEEIVSLVFCFPFDIDEYIMKNGINA